MSVQIKGLGGNGDKPTAWEQDDAADKLAATLQEVRSGGTGEPRPATVGHANVPTLPPQPKPSAFAFADRALRRQLDTQWEVIKSKASLLTECMEKGQVELRQVVCHDGAVLGELVCLVDGGGFLQGVHVATIIVS